MLSKIMSNSVEGVVSRAPTFSTRAANGMTQPLPRAPQRPSLLATRIEKALAAARAFVSARGTSARQRQNNARSRIIGNGMPSSQSNAPFPKPIVISCVR